MADINTNEKLLQELGDNASFHKTDVSSYDEQAKTFQEVWNRHGRIDALLANAGVPDRGSIYILNHRGSDKVPPKPNMVCTDISLKGLVYGTQLAIHFMRKNETPGGNIIATSSNAAVNPHEASPEYCGAKAGMIGFVRGASRVLKIACQRLVWITAIVDTTNMTTERQRSDQRRLAWRHSDAFGACWDDRRSPS